MRLRIEDVLFFFQSQATTFGSQSLPSLTSPHPRCPPIVLMHILWRPLLLSDAIRLVTPMALSSFKLGRCRILASLSNATLLQGSLRWRNRGLARLVDAIPNFRPLFSMAESSSPFDSVQFPGRDGLQEHEWLAPTQIPHHSKKPVTHLGSRPLASDRLVHHMSPASVAPHVSQPRNVRTHLPAQVVLDRQLAQRLR